MSFPHQMAEFEATVNRLKQEAYCSSCTPGALELLDLTTQLIAEIKVLAKEVDNAELNVLNYAFESVGYPKPGEEKNE